jgi:hypothetical protein
MRYLREYIDFTDIDDTNIGCNVLLFGNGRVDKNYIGIIDSDGYVNVLGYLGKFPIIVISDYNTGNNSRILLGDNNSIRYNDIDIEEVIPNLLIVGKDISFDELEKNIDYYKCDDIDGTFDRIKNLLKKYLDK